MTQMLKNQSNLKRKISYNSHQLNPNKIQTGKLSKLLVGITLSISYIKMDKSIWQHSPPNIKAKWRLRELHKVA